MPEDSQGREYRTLEARAANPHEYWVTRAAMGLAVDGAAGELRAHMGLAEDEVPAWMLIPRDEEHRADVATPAPTDAMTTSSPTLQRVFRPSVTSALNFQPMQVPAAERSFPVLTAGGSVGQTAVDTARESTAGSFRVETLLPVECRGRVTMRRSELATFPSAEMSLRRDLGQQIDDVMSQQIINGTGTAPEVSGLASIFTDGTPRSSVVDFAWFLTAMTGSVDGTYAADLSDIRLLLGRQVWAIAVGAYKADESDLSALDWLRMKCRSVTMSSHVPASVNTAGADEQKGQRAYLAFARGQMGSYSMPQWQGVRIIRDEYSDAARGWIHLTASLNWNFKVLRSDNYHKIVARVVS